VPFPPNYGGAIEIFYKIKYLHDSGCEIHLHCFYKNEKPLPSELENYCKTVHYYPRKTDVWNIFKQQPYIVSSRQNEDLLDNLLQNDYPILFEGLHTTGLLAHEKLRHRKKIVRLHNVEWLYYRQLFNTASNFKELIYFYSEYKKLLKYEPILENAQIITCLSSADNDYYKDKFLPVETIYVPVFHQHNEVKTITGRGDYILFHGNLSIADNYLPIIRWLKNELCGADYKIIVAGKNPTAHLAETVAKHRHSTLIANPPQAQMDELIQQAHINIIFSDIPTGVKLKLVNALFLGRFCFANEHVIAGTQLDRAVIPVDYTHLKDQLAVCMEKNFTPTMLAERKQLLDLYNNKKNAEKMLKCF
jgi:hypothetical protein